MKDYKEYIGRQVIIHGRPLGDMTGFIEDAIIGPNGDVELLGDWGFFTLHPGFDDFEITDVAGVRGSSDLDAIYRD